MGTKGVHQLAVDSYGEERLRVCVKFRNCEAGFLEGGGVRRNHKKNEGLRRYSSPYLGCDIWPVVKQLDSVSPCDLIANEPSEYFNRSKQTLLMFKKVDV